MGNPVPCLYRRFWAADGGWGFGQNKRHDARLHQIRKAEAILNAIKRSGMGWRSRVQIL